MNWYVTDTLLVLLFAFQHSVGTTDAAKNLVRIITGGRQFLWNLIYSLITLAVMYIMISQWESSPLIIWKVSGNAALVLRGIQAFSVFMFFFCFKYTSFGMWLGVAQFYRWITGKPQLEGYKINKTGLKRYVRFPHHTFLIPIFWAIPTFTLDLLLLAILATVYTWLGTVHQDSRGRRYFGKEWVEYSKSSRIIIPALEHLLVDIQNYLRKKRGEQTVPGFYDEEYSDPSLNQIKKFKVSEAEALAEHA